jgi:chromosome segregation ATPase
MVNISEKLDSIAWKVSLLTRHLEGLRQENKILKERYQEAENKSRTLTATIAERDREIEHLSETLKDYKNQLEWRSKMPIEEDAEKQKAQERALDAAKRSAQLREEIDQYISEIDKCIAWLKNY